MNGSVAKDISIEDRQPKNDDDRYYNKYRDTLAGHIQSEIQQRLRKSHQTNKPKSLHNEGERERETSICSKNSHLKETYT